LFTGSFHPIEDRQWENRCAWDKRVAPKEGVTLLEIFERRAIIRMATLKKHAIKVLSRFTPYLGQDPIKLIVEYLNASDCCALCVVCKVEAVKTPQTQNIAVNHVPLPFPPSSLFIGMMRNL
jgi:hypothetical protein